MSGLTPPQFCRSGCAPLAQAAAHGSGRDSVAFRPVIPPLSTWRRSVDTVNIRYASELLQAGNTLREQQLEDAREAAAR